MNEVLDLFLDEVKLKNLKLELKIESDYCLEIDKERLIGCVISLLSNSIKFTKQGGRIEIIVEKEQK